MFVPKEMNRLFKEEQNMMENDSSPAVLRTAIAKGYLKEDVHAYIDELGQVINNF